MQKFILAAICDVEDTGVLLNDLSRRVAVAFDRPNARHWDWDRGRFTPSHRRSFSKSVRRLETRNLVRRHKTRILAEGEKISIQMGANVIYPSKEGRRAGRTLKKMKEDGRFKDPY